MRSEGSMKHQHIFGPFSNLFGSVRRLYLERVARGEVMVMLLQEYSNKGYGSLSPLVSRDKLAEGRNIINIINVFAVVL